ncbi:hypothetical protein KRP22_012583 [Phytophthora ramorum]|nr:hypothetical protein KRP22_13019 [Phytophthora ramorum]
MMAPFVADVGILRLRDMRFTFDMVTMAIEEKGRADAMAVSNSHVSVASLTVAALVIIATTFAVLRMRNDGANLAGWNLTRIISSHRALSGSKRVEDTNDEEQDAGALKADPSEMLLDRARANKTTVV